MANLSEQGLISSYLNILFHLAILFCLSHGMVKQFTFSVFVNDYHTGAVTVNLLFLFIFLDKFVIRWSIENGMLSTGVIAARLFAHVYLTVTLESLR